MQNNNPLTEIGAIVLSALLIIAAALLVYAGRFSFAEASFAFTLAAGIFAGNLALKVPSPSQQAQLGQLTSQVLAAVATHTHPAPPTPAPVQPVPVAPQFDTTTNLHAPPTVPQVVQFVPDPGVSMAALSTAQMPVVQKDAQP